MFDNIITELLLLSILGILIIINTTLGVVIANNKKNVFKKEKLFKGIKKAIVITSCIALFCLCLELVPIVLIRVGIEMPIDLITTLEVIFVSLTAYKKYTLDCFAKMKTILSVNKEMEEK